MVEVGSDRSSSLDPTQFQILQSKAVPESDMFETHRDWVGRAGARGQGRRLARRGRGGMAAGDAA